MVLSSYRWLRAGRTGVLLALLLTMPAHADAGGEDYWQLVFRYDQQNVIPLPKHP